MAATLALIKRTDLASDSASLSLLDYTDGIALAADGWVVNVASDDDANVVETMALRLSASSHDALAAVTQSLDSFLRQAKLYRENNVEQKALWLRAKLDNESGARQALVLDTLQQPRTPIGGALAGNRIREYGLALTRSPLWESTASQSITVSSISGTGCSAALSASAGGDWPARIARLTIEGNSSPAGRTDTEIFVGLRSDRYGAPASEFVSLWEAEVAAPGIDSSTSATSDADSGCSVMRCGFASGDNEYARRMFWTLGDHITPASAHRGRFEILMRARVSAAASVLVKLRYGNSGDTDSATGEIVKITSTSSLYYPMGSIEFPFRRRGNTLQGNTVHLHASRTGGSGALMVDNIVLIPWDEGFMHAKAANISQDSDYDTVIHHNLGSNDLEGETVDMTTASLAEAIYKVEISGTTGRDWFLPAGSGVRAVAVVQSNDSQLGFTPSHSVQTKVRLTFDVYERYRTLRGSE